MLCESAVIFILSFKHLACILALKLGYLDRKDSHQSRLIKCFNIPHNIHNPLILVGPIGPLRLATIHTKSFLNELRYFVKPSFYFIFVGD